MNEYRFPEYPSSSSVANGVTVLVSSWFLVAAGAILGDPASPYTQRTVTEAAAPAARMVAQNTQAPRLMPAAMVTMPDARFTITVQAKRLKV
jgi:Na+/H+ antiporter NhaC